MVVQTVECVWLTQGDINRFNVENHRLTVVRKGQLIIVEPGLADRGVVENGLNINFVNAGKELVACNEVG